MMSAREIWRGFRAGGDLSRPLVDIGSSCLTGLRRSAAPTLRTCRHVGHPGLGTLSLTVTQAARLGSDFARAGLLFVPPSIEKDGFTDAFGVEWLHREGTSLPLRHPLEREDIATIARYPRPAWPGRIQFPSLTAGLVVVADAPCPGLLELCFLLRNGWQFMDDLADNRRAASALLDWSLETVTGAYEHMLAAMPADPDILIYDDDFGFAGSMFVSTQDFHIFLRPRLRALMSRLRCLTSAAICFHSCGAIRPILEDLVDLGIDILNPDRTARTMPEVLRQALPERLMLHGATDLVALGRAVAVRDMMAVTRLTSELVRSAPALAAPFDCLEEVVDLADARRAAAYLHALSSAPFDEPSPVAPVKPIVEHAIEASLLPRPTHQPIAAQIRPLQALVDSPLPDLE